MTRILIADDHAVVRQGFQQLLSQEPSFTLVGEAGDGATALRLVEELQPDVLVLDLVMPGLSGLEVLEGVRRCSPQTRVVVLSMYDDQSYVLRALRGGALAYLLKESSARDLIQAIQFVLQGRHYLSMPLVEHVVTAYLQAPRVNPTDPYESLSPREREVLHLLSEGHTSQQIATLFSLSRRTIETHRIRLMAKLGLHSKSDLLQYILAHQQQLALKYNPLPPESSL